MKIKLTFILGIALLFSVQGMAFAFPESASSIVGFNNNEQVSSFQFLGLANYQGIIRLSNCSGSLVRFEDTKQTDTAILLTNGHCQQYDSPSGMIPYGKFTVNLPYNRGVQLLSTDLQSVVGRLQTTRVVYSTMTGTDVTLYELNATYAEIFQKFGVSPLKVSTYHAIVGTPVAVVSGYWHKTYDCSVEKIVPILKEGEWISTESVRYSQECHVIGGTSGSPLVSKTTGEVVAINNTTNERGEQCTDDNPCETDADGRNVLVLEGRGYAQKTSDLYTCRFNGQFNFTAPTCKLFHN